MRKEFLIKNSQIIITQRNLLFILFICSFLIIFLQSILLIKKDTKIILIPNNLNKETILYSNKVSNEYLEAYTRDVIYSFLNLTPNNITYNEKTILSLTHPKFYGIIKNQFENLKTAIKSQKFTTTFYLEWILPNNEDLSVVVNGVLITFLGKKEISQVKKQYKIEYSYVSSKLYIIGFNEIKDEGTL